MLVYKEDFTRERQDREKTQCEKDQLQEQLQNCQELIAALNQEVLLPLQCNYLLYFQFSEYCRLIIIRTQSYDLMSTLSSMADNPA